VWRGQRLSLSPNPFSSTQATAEKCHQACASDNTCKLFQYNADTSICLR
jgi:hypothetical protein